MVTKPIRVIYADKTKTVREFFSVSDTNSTLKIYNFDNLSKPDNIHDQINLTALFDALGGAYNDGSNDLKDRASAIKLSYGDYDGDGKADDVRLTIAGVSDFKIDFIDPAYYGSGGFDIGSGSGVYDDIALMKTAPATPAASADGATAKPGGGTVYDSALNSFSITSDGHIKVNDAIDPYTNGVTALVVENGVLYQTAPDPSNGGATAAWWQYTPGSGWNNWTKTTSPLDGGTATPPPAPSPAPAPAPAPSPSTGDSDLYLGKYPAHWARLSNGINVERSELSKVSDADMKYLHDIGVENFRVFLSPNDYLKFGQPMNPETNGWIQHLKGFMDRAIKAGIAVVVTPFGNETRPAYMSNPNDTASINQYISWTKEFAAWIKKHYSPTDVFIETRNEPVLDTAADNTTDAKTWWAIQEKFIKAIHEVAPDFTVEATANRWSSWDYLTKMGAYADQNVVYGIHYYQPMSFTHQGASWVNWAADLSNIQWPGAEGKTLAAVQNDFAKVKAWADAQDAFIHIGEFGVIKYAPADDRAQWMTDLRAIFDKYGWGWSAWDYNKAFGITTSDSAGREAVIDSLLKALDWGKYSQADSPWDALSNSTTSTSSISTTLAKTTATLSPASTSTETVSYKADSAFAVAEKFALTADQLTKTVNITNFDSVSGTSTGIKDQVSLDAIFDALGGKFTDGVNDLADRKAALNLAMLDINKDGVQDMQLTIDGAGSFHLNFLSPNQAYTTAFEIGDGHGAYDNIVIA